MNSGHAIDDYVQEFRVLSNSCTIPVSKSTVFVTSRPDQKTGERVLLWKDIQKEVKDADHVKNGRSSVYFMTDGNFEE